MTRHLLATKLHLPRRQRSLVPRPRLTELLDRGGTGALTLVSAPAGFGKTSVLTEWLVGGGRSAGWLSLDARDNDPVLFWTYLVTAVRSAMPEVGAAALALLESSDVPTDQVLATLVNELDAVPADLVVVLDDYHCVTAPEIHAGVGFLLDHLAPQVHLVIATRSDPALPLARWRVRGELVEIRAHELRFTADEAAVYLNESMGLTLTAADVAALDARTEGWIAALQLAALSMQDRDDVAGFIANFAGDDRYIVDYLAEEVLQRQPDEVRTFLLQTSILARLTGALCDAVVGRPGGAARLTELDRGNLFVVALDDRRQWYRYHQLFADVLQARLLDEQPDHVLDLHRRASSWYSANDEPSEAIRHALAGRDPERAADLVELAMPALRQTRQESTVRHWLASLPRQVLLSRPQLSTTYAGALLMHGETGGVEELLTDVERWFAEHTTSPADTNQDTRFRRIRGEVAVYRAALARIAGNAADTVRFAQEALSLVGDGDHLLRGSASGMLGLAFWSAGDLPSAHRYWSESHDSLERAGYRADMRGVALALADIEVALGRLRAALATCERDLAGATMPGMPVLRGAADMHVAISELLCEQNDLAGARRHLDAATGLGELAGLPQNRHRRRVAMARVLAAEGKLDDAIAQLDEAERLYVGDMFPEVRPISAVRARIWVEQRHTDAALGWARERGLSVEDSAVYLREFEHLTLVRALLTRSPSAGELARVDAVRLLQRLLVAAEQGERTGSVIEILVLQALALQASHDPGAALGALDRALMLAEPQGYVRVFLDAGASAVALLNTVGTQSASAAYARRLVTAAGHGTVVPSPGLVVQLSAREREVLRLLGTDLDGPGIARQLVVSLNTVRTHTKNIYAKLGVNNRRAAVRRAVDLDLLPGRRAR